MYARSRQSIRRYVNLTRSLIYTNQCASVRDVESAGDNGLTNYNGHYRYIRPSPIFGCLWLSLAVCLPSAVWLHWLSGDIGAKTPEPIVGNGPYAASLAPSAPARRLEPQIRHRGLKGRYGALQPLFGLSVAMWRSDRQHEQLHRRR